jgi:DNA modification methylase
MPVLCWPGKQTPQPEPAKLVLESLVFPQGVGYLEHLASGQTRLPNRLIWGENLAVMAALLPEYEGKIDLIYADPPFFSNRRYPARVGRNEDSRKPGEWKLAEGYGDHWVDLESYLDMLFPRLVLMHRLLSPTGSLYLHLDWHANAYARVLLDEIFGQDRLLNEVVWLYHGPSPIRSAFNRKHDTILVYTKSDRYTFNVDEVRTPYNDNTVKTFASSSKAGFGKIPDLARGKVPEDWWYFPVVARLHSERSGYPTQKPEALLERIVRASSNPGDLVADFFCGSGTAPLVAARLQRNFIAVDSQRRAVHTARHRLVATGVSPFQMETASGLHPELDHSAAPVLGWSAEDVFFKHPGGELDYWELDLAWDGVIFRSAAQAFRAHRNDQLPERLSMQGVRGKRRICVRYVLSNGGEGQLSLFD